MHKARGMFWARLLSISVRLIIWACWCVQLAGAYVCVGCQSHSLVVSSAQAGFSACAWPVTPFSFASSSAMRRTLFAKLCVCARLQGLADPAVVVLDFPICLLKLALLETRYERAIAAAMMDWCSQLGAHPGRHLCLSRLARRALLHKLGGMYNVRAAPLATASCCLFNSAVFLCAISCYYGCAM